MGGTSASGTIGRSSMWIGDESVPNPSTAVQVPENLRKAILEDSTYSWIWRNATDAERRKMIREFSPAVPISEVNGMVLSSIGKDSIDLDQIRADIRGWPDGPARNEGFRALAVIDITSSSPQTFTVKSPSGQTVAIGKVVTPNARHFKDRFADGIPPGKYLEMRELGSISPGQGKRILEHAMATARKKGRGLVLRSAESATGFYKKMGFSQSSTDEAVFYIPPGG